MHSAAKWLIDFDTAIPASGRMLDICMNKTRKDLCFGLVRCFVTPRQKTGAELSVNFHGKYHNENTTLSGGICFAPMKVTLQYLYCRQIRHADILNYSIKVTTHNINKTTSVTKRQQLPVYCGKAGARIVLLLFFFFSDNAHSSELSNVVHGNPSSTDR